MFVENKMISSVVVNLGLAAWKMTYIAATLNATSPQILIFILLPSRALLRGYLASVGPAPFPGVGEGGGLHLCQV